MLADVHFRVELEVRFEARFRQNENDQPADRQRKSILTTFITYLFQKGIFCSTVVEKTNRFLHLFSNGRGRK